MKFDTSQLLIYAVTDRAWTGKMSLYEQTEAALKGGATMVQLREKGLRDDNVEEYLEEAKKMRALTEKYNVPLLIDDNIKLAKACGADGVHVGQNDMDAGLARQLLGPDKILGVTAKTVEQAFASFILSSIRRGTLYFSVRARIFFASSRYSSTLSSRSPFSRSCTMVAPPFKAASVCS
jgi:thiamine-phosphate diphosphorylase